ncbi:MAG: hypothetical protein IT176_12485 [Acidobacteria bacterium]|nr:hypothetical protein [Acidobacteriota bacterium]
MTHRFTRRLYTVLGLAAAIAAAAAAPASAQFQPRPLGTPPVGEAYHIEAAAAFWMPAADAVVSSSGFGITGSAIDFRRDLGLTDRRFPALSLQLRPARKHKFRFQYIPIEYEQSAILQHDVVFNGQRYSLGLPVSSSLLWKAYRFGYEYDFVSRDAVFAGIIAEVKYTDVTARLRVPIRELNEYGRAYAPIPALGGIVRVRPVPNLAVTADITGFTVPKRVADRVSPGSKAHYVDVDVAATWNFANQLGAQVGYRSLDMGYTYKEDSGAFTFKGLYFGAVARY